MNIYYYPIYILLANMTTPEANIVHRFINNNLDMSTWVVQQCNNGKTKSLI